jgi:hypothetical protein
MDNLAKVRPSGRHPRTANGLGAVALLAVHDEVLADGFRESSHDDRERSKNIRANGVIRAGQAVATNDSQDPGLVRAGEREPG